MQVIDEGECIDVPVENTAVSLFFSQSAEDIKPHVHKDETGVVVDPSATNNGEDQPQQMSHAEILQYAKSSPDSGRKFTLDNIDIHQTIITLMRITVHSCQLKTEFQVILYNLIYICCTLFKIHIYYTDISHPMNDDYPNLKLLSTAFMFF